MNWEWKFARFEGKIAAKRKQQIADDLRWVLSACALYPDVFTTENNEVCCERLEMQDYLSYDLMGFAARRWCKNIIFVFGNYFFGVGQLEMTALVP